MHAGSSTVSEDVQVQLNARMLELTIDDFDLSKHGDSTFTFNDATTAKEMESLYLLKPDMFEFLLLRFYKYDCTEILTGGEFTIAERSVIEKTTEDEKAKFVIDMDLPKIVNNPDLYSEPAGEYTAEIKFCSKADLIIGQDLDGNTSNSLTTYDGVAGDSVSFQETKYTLTVTMSKDFSTVNVQAVRESALQSEVTSNTEYSVNACQCNDEGACVQDGLNQNSMLNICINLDNSAVGVAIADVKTLTLTQDSLVVKAVEDKVTSSLTNVAGQLTDNIVVETRLISSFFTASGDGEAIVVDGIVVIAFQSGRRQLSAFRRAQDSSGEANFSFEIQLVDDEEGSEESSAVSSSSTIAMVAVAVGFFGLL